MQKKTTVTLAAAMMMAVPAISLAAMAGSNTVNSAAIVDSSIATADIANLAVTSAKLANGSVTAAKLGITCTAGQTLSYTTSGWVCSAGTPGPTGPAGPQGIQGIQGPTGSGVKYGQVLVVAKSGGNYTSLATALASITDASAAKPYLVKVMAGVYDLGTTSLQMKSFVTVEGVGDSSVITSSVDTDPDATGSYCSGGTVRMANNSTLKNIKVVNKGLSAHEGIGVSFYNANAALDDVTVIAEAGTANGYQRNAVCAEGSLTNAVINNARLEGSCIDGESGALDMSNYAKVIVSNSKLKANNVDGTSYGIDCNHAGGDAGAEFTLLSSLVDVNVTGGGNNEGYYGSACSKTFILNSKFTSNSCNHSKGIQNDRDTFVLNSQFFMSPNLDGTPAQMLGWSPDYGATMKISNSILQGTFEQLTNVRLFNNTDENLNPIVNQ